MLYGNRGQREQKQSVEPSDHAKHALIIHWALSKCHTLCVHFICLFLYKCHGTYIYTRKNYPHLQMRELRPKASRALPQVCRQQC